MRGKLGRTLSKLKLKVKYCITFPACNNLTRAGFALIFLRRTYFKQSIIFMSRVVNSVRSYVRKYQYFALKRDFSIKICDIRFYRTKQEISIKSKNNRIL